jgi:hypothetical protein
MQLQIGSRWKSTACDTEVIVIKGAGDVALTCGGAEMSAGGEGLERCSLDPRFVKGSIVGKRYVTADGDVEVLCVKPGKGSLAIDGVPLNIKDTKPLPSSD